MNHKDGHANMALQIPDQTIASQVNIPDPMKPISGFLNIAQQGQNLKSSQLNYQVADQANQKRNQLRDLAAKSVNTDGTFNQAAFSSQAPQIDPEQGLKLGSDALTNQSQGIANKTNEMSYQGAQTSKTSQILTSLASDPDVLKATPAGTQKVLQAGRLAQLAGVDPEHADSITTAILHTPANGRAQLLSNFQRAMMGAEQQRADENPAVSMVDDGQQKVPFNSNPRSPGGVGVMGGVTPIQNQLPPTTPTVGGPGGTTPGYVGATGGVSPAGMTATPGGMTIPPQAQAGMDGTKLALLQQERAASTNPSDIAILDREIMRAKMSLPQSQQAQAPASKFVPSGLPAGAGAAIAGTQDQVTKHYSEIGRASCRERV